MKLCRFVLLQSPGKARSGIFLNNRIYETEADKGVGIHDLSKIKLLPPLGQPPTIRQFVRNPQNELDYFYLNPVGIVGPLAEIEPPTFATALDLQISIATIVKDRGEQIDAEEAEGFVLGYTILVILVAENVRSKEVVPGIPPGRSMDFAVAAGPFLCTPDEIDEQSSGPQALSISVNGEQVYESEYVGRPPGPELVVEASRSTVVNPGDLLSCPPFIKASLSKTPLGRYLLPGDSISVAIAPFGALHLKVV